VFNFFNYKLNRKILTAFFLIILIPGVCSLLVNNYSLYRTLRNETENRLETGAAVYFEEVDNIRERCLTVAQIFSNKEFVKRRLLRGEEEEGQARFEQELIDFYRMDLVDIIEVEDREGRVIFRGHNPQMAGDIKTSQQVIRDGLAGQTGVTFEYGQSGFAIRAVVPVRQDDRVIGLFMTGALFSEEFARHLKDLTLLENGLYRENHRIVATYTGLETLDHETVSRLRAGEPVFLRNRKLSNGRYNLLIKPLFLKGEYWGAVCLGVSGTESEKLLEYSSRQTALMILIGVLLALLIYFFLARSINASLVKIITGISGYSFDRPNEEITLAGNDEFGLIAENFNTLIRRVDLYNQRIRKLQNDLIKSTRLATAGQMAACIAHEIRNPLSSIKMMAQIIRSRYLTDTSGREEMNVILEEIDRINDKVKELLEFSRPGPMEFASQDIRPLLESILKLSAGMIEKNGIRLTADYDPALPELYVDAEKLRICFMNIVINAIQAMPGGGELIIRTGQAGEHVYVRICNTGPTDGLPSEEELFEPFFTTRKEGTGLGLAISKLVIERHNGTIGLTRREDRICFNIKLPVGTEKE